MALYVGNFDPSSSHTNEFRGYYFTTSDGSTTLSSSYEALGLAFESVDNMSLIIKVNGNVYTVTAFNSEPVVKKVSTGSASALSGISFAVGGELYYII